MSSDFHDDARLPRLRRLITAAIAADIATHLVANNSKRDDFTTGKLLIQAEIIESTWLKMSSKLQNYANQTKLFKSTMYKLKLGTFLREHAPSQNDKEEKKTDGKKLQKIELDIDEIKKQIKKLAGQKRKHEEIENDNIKIST
jgi:hypothetical protein